MNYDPEISALNAVYESLKGLKGGQVKRIIQWIKSKFALNEEIAVPPADPVISETVPPGAEPVGKKPRRTYKRRQKAPEAPAALPPDAEGPNVFMRYETLEDLFKTAKVNTFSSKILLTAAYIQEKNRQKEFNTHDINTRLKALGESVQNISSSINSLMNKKPALLVQTGRMSRSKQGRRTYSVTGHGLSIARSYIDR